MPRMSDEVFRLPMRAPVWWGGDVERATKECRETLLEGVRKSLIIVADNVAEYLFSGTDQEEWDILQDFPCLAPPSDHFWIECRPPSRIVSRETGVTELSKKSNASECAGLLFDALDLAKDPGDPDAPWTRYYEGVAPSARWILAARYYRQERCGKDQAIIGPVCYWQIAVDGKGKALHSNYAVVGGPAGAVTDPLAAVPGLTSLGAFNTEIFAPLLALSFMSCRNVEKVANDPPKALSRKHEKKHGRLLCRYYTLEIDPMRQVLKREGGAEKTGLKRALHICRGHFAHYTEDKPMFGRIVGSVWRPMHARGSIGEGVIAKDYAVKSKSR